MIQYLVKKRKITLLFFTIVVMYGFISFFQLPRQEVPDIVSNKAIVTTVLPGASPEKVEQTVTKIVEEKINEIQGLESITSESKQQISIITVEAKKGVDAKAKWEELRKKVQDSEKDLPADAKQPIVNDELSRTFIQTLAVTADSEEKLYSLRDTVKSWKDQLRTLPNISDISINGLPEKEVRVEIDTWKLNQFGIQWPQVSAAILKENNKMPLGDFDIKDRVYQLKIRESYDPDELNNTIIANSKDGFPIYLKDVGKVYTDTEKVETYVYYNGKPAISISIEAEIGSDVPSLQKNVDKMMKTLEKSLPEEAEVHEVYSQNERINELFLDLAKETTVAIIAVLFVCSLGLNFITSFVIALAIPISLAIGLMFTPQMNITMNMISVVALIIVLGILVDDAVVVNDNIERRLVELGESPLIASINGSIEVYYSILTATLATICSFGPLAFLQGNVGQFIKPIPIIISLSMLASMLMSLTIVPIFRHWYHTRNGKDRKDNHKTPGLLGKQLTQLTEWYANKLMPEILKHPLKAGLIAVLISTLAYGLFPLIPVQMFPNAVRAEMLVDIQVSNGSNIEKTKDIVKGVSNWVQSQPGVKMTTAYVGESAPNMFKGDTSIGNGIEVGQLIIKVDTKKVKTADIVPAWQKEFENMYPEARIIPKELKSGPSVGKAVDIRIFGDDIQVLRALDKQVKDKLAAIQGVYKLEDNIGVDRYTLQFEVNKALMDKKLVNYEELTKSIRLAGEGITISSFDDGKDLVDIKLYSTLSSVDPLLTFQRLTVANVKGEQIPLSEIAEIKPSFSIKQIPHRDLSRVVSITGDVKVRTATEVMKEMKPILDNIKLPEGYRIEMGGETSEQKDVFIDLGKLLIVAVFLIFILIAIQFYSLSLPILVMSTVYLAFAGSMVGLFLTRTPFSFMSVMGGICLVGIVVRNGIVLIEFIENERHAGVELRQAVINAGRARLRPVILTASTAIAGLLSLATSNELMFRSLSISIIFGLFFSTILTLVVVPSFYTVLTEYKMKRAVKEDNPSSHITA